MTIRPPSRFAGLVGLRLGDLAEPIDVVATAVVRRLRACFGVPDVDVHERRHDGAARLVGQHAAVDVHTRRQRRADLGQRARDREQRPFGLAHAVARDGLQQPDGVRVLRRLEDLDGVALLDDGAGVHHADAVAHRPDHAEVVGDQQDRRVRLLAQRPDEVEDLGFDGGVEARRRLVEHEQLGVAGQRHRDDDTLLHAARQLVRVAVHHPLGIGDAHAAQRPEGVLPRRAPVLAEDREGLGDLAADAQRRVQRRAGVLVHHRGVAGPEPPQLAVGHPRDVGSGDEDPPARDDPVGRQVAHGGEGRGRLAATRFADEPVGLAGADVERHPAEHLAWDAAHEVGEVEVLDGEGVRGRRGGQRGLDAHAALTASIESATRLVAMTRLAIASAGNSVGHHCPAWMNW